MTNFLDEVRSRITELSDERERLSIEITNRQGRYALVTTELTHLEALITLHEAGHGGGLRAQVMSDADVRPAGAGRPTQPGLELKPATPGPVGAATSEVSMQPTPATPVATPRDGAWKAEAIRLLEEHGQPMHYRHLYRALAARGFIFGGRNPEGVLLTGVSREKLIFVSMGRGEYWLAGREPAAAASVAAPSKSRADARRPRPIGQAQRRRA